MTKRTLSLSSFSIALALALAPGCAGGDGQVGDGDGDGDTSPDDAPVTLDDVVDLGDLIQQESDAASAAAQLGDPAELLQVAQSSGERIRGHIAAILDRIDNITDGEPDATGQTPGGRPFARWERTDDDGTAFRFTVIRVNERRLRYVLQGRGADETELRGLMTGIFVRSPDGVARRGGGRLHLNMTALTDLGRGPMLDGSIHFVFANGDDARRGRRVYYRNVRERGAMELPANYAADLFRRVGEGGRMRSVIVDDILPELPGRELYAVRVAWRRGEGGRGAAGLASFNAGEPVRLGAAHECWDAAGLRTFYADTYPGNDDVNPNAGDEADCISLVREDAPETEADAEDLDEELTDVLEEAGASDITEDEAGAGDDIPA